MTNDSLIGQLTALQAQLDRFCNETFPLSNAQAYPYLAQVKITVNTIIASVQTLNTSGERVQELADIERLYPSEICEDKIKEIADYIWRKMQPGESGISRNMIATEIKDSLKPYLRATEPVSVDDGVTALMKLEDSLDADIHSHDMPKIVKAVLDAAGVPYVD